MAKGAFAASRGVGRATPQPCPGKCLVGERQSDGASTRLPKSVLATSQPGRFPAVEAPAYVNGGSTWSHLQVGHKPRPMALRAADPTHRRTARFSRPGISPDAEDTEGGKEALRVPQGAVCDQPARAAPRRAAAGGICANDGLTERPQGAVCGHGAAARGPKAFRRATCWPLRRAVRGALRWAARSPA